jgi:cytochrome c oxidase subunit I+III
MSDTTVRNVDRSTAKPVNLAPLYSRDKLGVWFFLGGEVVLFGTLILTYSLFRIRYAADYASFRSHLSVLLIGINTFVLVTSSYFVVRTLQAAKQRRQNAMLINLLIVFALGALFISGQAYEWSTLFSQGITVTNTFGSAFFVVTGIHGTHVLIGMTWATVLLVFGMNVKEGDRPDRPVELFGLYWHFVDIVWIVLFFLIYLL